MHVVYLVPLTKHYNPLFDEYNLRASHGQARGVHLEFMFEFGLLFPSTMNLLNLACHVTNYSSCYAKYLMNFESVATRILAIFVIFICVLVDT